MKIERLETHDRFQHLMKQQSDIVSQGAENCLKTNPLSLAYQARSPYIYIWGHPRTGDDGVTKRFLWQPRLSKPPAQTNSYLFRAQSHTDIMEVCWMIPPREMWPQYSRDKMTHHELVIWSIQQFRYNRQELEKPYPDDMSEEQAKNILRDILSAHLQEIRMNKMYAKPKTSVVSQDSWASLDSPPEYQSSAQ